MKPVRRFSFVNTFILFACYLNTLSRLLLLFLLLTTASTSTTVEAAGAAAMSSTAALTSSTRSYNPCAVANSIAGIRRVHFTNDTFTGYVSENLNLHQDSPPPSSPHDHNPDLDKWRRNVVVRSGTTSSSSRPVVYVRFVDRLKPSLRVRISASTTTTTCSCLSDDQLNVTFASLDYEQEPALELFQLDRESISCMEIDAGDEDENTEVTECLCYFQMRLSDDPMIRDRLNREAKEAYKFQISTMNASATINIQVINNFFLLLLYFFCCLN